MSTTIVLFAVGWGAAALLYSLFGVKCFVVPPIMGTIQLIVRLIEWLQSRRDDDCADEPQHMGRTGTNLGFE